MEVRIQGLPLGQEHMLNEVQEHERMAGDRRCAV